MKRFTYRIFTIMSLAAALCSCNRYLDKMPDNRTELDTPEKLTQMLISAYEICQPVLMPELMSDNITDAGKGVSVGKDLYQEMYLYKEVSSTSTDSPSSIWSDNYAAIAAANHVIDAIETREWNGADLSAQMGEALVCRAYAHFNLVNMFCEAYNKETSGTDLGIPYITKPETVVFVNNDRGTVAQVYENIAKDLEAGIPLLRDDAYAQPKFHFTKRAAQAFANQFYLYYMDYDKSIKYGEEALGIEPSALYRNWSKMDNCTSSQEYTNVYVSSDEAANFFMVGFSSYSSRFKSYRYCMTSAIAYLTFRSSSGPWGSYTLPAYNHAYGISSRSYFFPKINEFFMYTNVEQGIGYPYVVTVVYCTGKALINIAEAYLLNKNYDKCAEYLSRFYESALATCGPLTAEQISNFYYTEAGEQYVSSIHPRTAFEEGVETGLLHACLHARRIVGCQEGLRLHDIKRYGISFVHEVDMAENIKIDPYDKRLVAQIPRLVVSAGLKPNPTN